MPNSLSLLSFESLTSGSIFLPALTGTDIGERQVGESIGRTNIDLLMKGRVRDG
jgi:hypothetical protein